MKLFASFFYYAQKKERQQNRKLHHFNQALYMHYTSITTEVCFIGISRALSKLT